MSAYRKIMNQRVEKIEARLAAAQRLRDANRPSLYHDVLAEGDRVLQPGMWDWILKTAEPLQQQDRISRIASLLAADKGWVLTGGWSDTPLYWALKGCTFSFDKLNTDGLFYFFQCSRADFDSLPENVRNEAWDEAVRQLTTVLRDPEACTFNKDRPNEARLLVDALFKCNLPQLLKPHLSLRTVCVNGSKEALLAWVNVEYKRQNSKRTNHPTGGPNRSSNSHTFRPFP